DASGARLRWAIDDVRVFDRDCAAVPGGLVAAFTSSAPVCDGSDVTFDAGPTSGGTPAYAFDWDFGDSGQLAGAPATVTHRYAAPGTYMVKLTARDSAAASDSVTMPVVVVDDRPAPDLGDVVRAVKSKDASGAANDVRLSWNLPPGPWPSSDVM